MAAATHPNFRDRSITQPLLEADEYDEYSWVLLEDHPLRSPPAECCPGIVWVIHRCCAAVSKRWSDRALSLICLFLMFLVAIQFLSLLPYGVSYIFLREQYKQQTGFVHWPVEFNNQPAACISYNPRAHSSAIQYSVAAGCTGIKADIWLQDDDLLVGPSTSSLKKESTLRSVYLEPLLDQLDARNTDEAQSDHGTMSAWTGLFEWNPMQQATLFLEIRSSTQDVWPRLFSELALLSERGYLTHRNGTLVVPGPITIVLTGRDHVNIYDTHLVDHKNLVDYLFFDERLIVDAEGSAATPASTEDQQDHFEQSSRISIPDLDIPPLGRAIQLYSASVNFSTAIGSPHRGRFSPRQIDLIKSQVRAAHQRGLLARYEGIPCYSEGMRRIIWRILVNEGADFIEVDWTGCASRGWRRFFSIGARDWSGNQSRHLLWPWGK
ncbi:hypothetical protein BO94DRAFT_34959 [Aspergillus sclerotioniger CBS 115572]|uniref:Altered inheritance of mitochondria protein 6 n=1 Tax=Aspergillus sclerotioniger CBS 115572 TaxID=1450535 RepID=A0A317WVU5_9EURO|nr:hypothetical protein BO94DRAFT_34959 [Aspergillus sclerotioniger CBS 115572]PWY89422.1 hypothetical protein BO94DRAFT_34959 [Aspergillus sclerotioniger CBS 115572]